MRIISPGLSLPTRERELKHVRRGLEADGVRVAPYTGA